MRLPLPNTHGSHAWGQEFCPFTVVRPILSTYHHSGPELVQPQRPTSDGPSSLSGDRDRGGQGRCLIWHHWRCPSAARPVAASSPLQE
jgi:hypothetical protein